MNKTAILSYILDEVALKCRNVSSNMRKRIHWMLKHMEIIVKKYDERALIFNGWIRVGKRWIRISKVKEMKKGVSNYSLSTKKQVDRTMTLNNEVRCYSLNFIPTAPIEVESIEYLWINQNDYDFFSKCSFNTVKQLELYDLSLDQIKFILTRCKRVNTFDISRSSLQKLNFSKSRIRKFCFNSISFKEPVYLPREIEQLELRDCTSPKLIKGQKVNKIHLSNGRNDPKEYVELIKTLRGVKVATINRFLEQYLTSFPSTIRKIEAPWHILDILQAANSQFPYLIEVIGEFPIQPTDTSELRVIYPILQETEEKFNLRPRKITVDDYNVRQLNNHPELFEKVDWVCIEHNKFNLDVLPSEIKRIEIKTYVNTESVILNRLKKERG